MFAGLAYGTIIASCFSMSCGSEVLATQNGTVGFSAQAIKDLAWDNLYANLYVVAIGCSTFLIGLNSFRNGERWAWYCVLLFVSTAFLTSLIDYLSWG